MERKESRRLGAGAWQAVLARFARGDMTVEEFCDREWICKSSFYRWRSILGSSSAVSAATDLAVPVMKRPPAFVDLGTLSAGTLSAGGSRCEVRLDLGGGITLSLVRG